MGPRAPAGVDRRALAGLLLAAALLVAGCVGATGGGATGGGGTAPSRAAEGTGPTVTVTVERVVDGDTVRVRYDDGRTDTVRLVGVDTPETRGGNDPGEFEGVPATAAGRDCLGRWGQRASEFAEGALAGRSVGLGFDPRGDRRGYYDRLLAYVYVDGEQFNRRLVTEGYARLFDGEFVERERYAAAESEARAAGRGLWTCTTPGDGDGDYDWGREGAVWNDDGDTVTVRTGDGVVSG